MEWDKLLLALYGVKLSDEEFEIWEELLSPEKPSGQELSGAITLASERGVKTRGYRATVPDVKAWLKAYRDKQCGKVEGSK